VRIDVKSSVKKDVKSYSNNPLERSLIINLIDP